MVRRSFDIEHVLMTADAVGGVWTYCLDLARGLARHGVRTTLAVMGPGPSATQVEEALLIPNLSLHAAPFKLEWMDGPWEEIDAAGDWLLDLAQRVEPDIIHLNGYAHAALPWSIPSVVVCHSDVLSWFQAVRGVPAPQDDWSEYTRRVRTGLHSAGLVIAPTQAVLDEVQSHYGTLDGARVVYNGRTASEFVPGTKRPMVFSVGRFWDEASNLSLLQSVAPDLDWPVYLAGDVGENRPKAGTVNFLGRLGPSAISAWLGRASIYALPAKYEPLGLSILEAALSGCALVLGDIPNLRELWDGAALFVDPRDAGALRDTLNALAQDDVSRTYLAHAARERAVHYSVSALANNMLFAYQDVKQTNLLDLTVFRQPPVSVR